MPSTSVLLEYAMEQPELSDSAIETSGLTKRFGQLTAVDHLDLAVKRGSIFGLVGPDGAGKTTTLRMLCGALVPTSGTARVAGFDVVRQTELARLQLGYMPQSFSLYPDLSVQGEPGVLRGRSTKCRERCARRAWTSS